MRPFWLGVEDYLITHFPAAARLTTPFDDPAFETATDRSFLASLGSGPVATAAYGKDLPPIA